MPDRNQQIRELAYAIWEQEGRPDGQADRHWEMARKAVEVFEGAEVAVQMNADSVSRDGKPFVRDNQAAPEHEPVSEAVRRLPRAKLL